MTEALDVVETFIREIEAGSGAWFGHGNRVEIDRDSFERAILSVARQAGASAERFECAGHEDDDLLFLVARDRAPGVDRYRVFGRLSAENPAGLIPH